MGGRHEESVLLLGRDVKGNVLDLGHAANVYFVARRFL